VPDFRPRMDGMIDASPGRIDLWFTLFGELRDAHLLNAYRRLLTGEELHKASKFRFEIDCRRYLVTRALVRTVLSRYAPVAPESWRFAANRYGRPEIVSTDARIRGLSFNISHCSGLIVVGLTRGRSLGVDVENVADREAPLDIVDRFFAPDEIAALNSLAEAQQRDRFFEYWTFKESYIKARGLGLSVPLDRFSFDLGDPDRVRLTIDPALGDSPTRWEFWQFRPRPEHLVAVCAECVGPRPVVPGRYVVPLVSEEALNLSPQRISKA
jgi:4'-phosphopantetheinyl transferase